MKHLITGLQHIGILTNNIEIFGMQYCLSGNTWRGSGWDSKSNYTKRRRNRMGMARRCMSQRQPHSWKI